MVLFLLSFQFVFPVPVAPAPRPSYTSTHLDIPLTPTATLSISGLKQVQQPKSALTLRSGGSTYRPAPQRPARTRHPLQQRYARSMLKPTPCMKPMSITDSPVLGNPAYKSKSALRARYVSLATLRIAGRLAAERQRERTNNPLGRGALSQAMSEGMQARTAAHRASRAERMTTSCSECRRRKQKVCTPCSFAAGSAGSTASGRA